MLKSMSAAAVIASLLLASPAAAKTDPALQAQALDILKRSIGFRTVVGSDQFVPYAEYLKGVLVSAGYAPADIKIEKVAGAATLVARYPGKDPAKKPIVVSGHMDVVEAKPADWDRDPFTAVVENGWIYGRGAVDNKFDVSVVVATLADLRRKGWKPGRDIILALSGDEETTMATTQHLAQQLKHAEMVLNADGGGGMLGEDGQPVAYGLQAAEKTYADFTLSVTDAGGHSSRPTPTNPIYRLSRALDRLSAYQFPVTSNEITRGSLAIAAANTPGSVGEAMRRFAADPNDQAAIKTLAADPDYGTILRTTCVATQLSGGHAPNALPQRAEANVNCRIFPGTPSESVRQTIVGILADPSISVTRVVGDGAIDSPASPLRDDVVKAVTKAVRARYPTMPVAPEMAAGAPDSMHFRAVGVPSYGVAGLVMKPGEAFAHGLNEKAPVAAIDGALAHWDSILRDLGK